MGQNLVEATGEEDTLLKRRLDLPQYANPTCAASIDASDNRRHGVAAAYVGSAASGASGGSMAAHMSWVSISASSLRPSLRSRTRSIAAVAARRAALTVHPFSLCARRMAGEEIARAMRLHCPAR